MRTYISLFSSAGVGCYGFKMNGFECVASNELLSPRIEIQKVNHKCKYESGYICGDATKEETHQRIAEEIAMWQQVEHLEQVDVVFATPPCQGMSTANYKKNDHEQIRNSLVVQAIRLIMEIHPKVFVFENVRAFLKSTCTDLTGDDMTIKDSIIRNLSKDYNIYWKVVNFKDYGVPSSRPRTLVIGTSKQLPNISPLMLFPTRANEIPLRQSIGHLAHLEYGARDTSDPFHFARPFPEYMLNWIKDLGEGETAFDNPDETKPCTFDQNGNRIVNKGAYMGNKYRRLIWDRPGACIATRSDVMSSQDTIHPCDNRVLSIRELMILMTIPQTFKWTAFDDMVTPQNAQKYLDKNECNIRRCIGEAVPTHIGDAVAKKISFALDYQDWLNHQLDNIPHDNFYIKTHNMRGFALDAEKVFEDLKKLNAEQEEISVKIETISDFVTFVPSLTSFFSEAKKITIDVYCIEKEIKTQLLESLENFDLGVNTEIHFYSEDDHRSHNIVVKYDGCQYYSFHQKAVQENADQLTLF